MNVYAGEEYALGTLNKEKCPHFKLDLIMVDEEFKLRHTGKSPVHVTGYQGLSFGEDISDDEYSYGTLLLLNCCLLISVGHGSFLRLTMNDSLSCGR